MKIRLLNDTDFFRITVLTEAEQWRELLRMTGTFSEYTLMPTRRRYSDIFNLELPLFSGLSHAHVPWEVVEGVLKKECRPGTEFEQNCLVSSLLHGFATERVTVSRPLPYVGLRLGQERKPWIAKYLVVDGRPVLVSVDPRGGNGLTPAARQAVFSAMHVGVRELDSEFAQAALLILQTPHRGRGEHKTRTLRVTWSEGPLPYSYSDLQKMAALTEALWIEAQFEQERRRRAG